MVLAMALKLRAFSVPQLASQCGVGYELVEWTLAEEEGRTVRRTGEMTAAGLLPPTEVWVVSDPDALATRLGEAVDPPEPMHEDEDEEEDDVEHRLASAEDCVKIGLRAGTPDDATALAYEALMYLETDDDAEPLPEAPSEDAPLVVDRNLPAPERREWIVRTLAAYLISGEAAGIAGARWRDAFRALAAVDMPEHAALHKRLLVDLVRVADERAARRAYGMPAAEVVALMQLALSEPAAFAGLLEPHHDDLRAAVAKLLDELGHRHRDAADEVTGGLCTIAARLFAPSAFAAPEVIEQAIKGLRKLAWRPEGEVAAAAQSALAAIGGPREAAFWTDLADAPRPAPPHLIFAGLSQFDMDAAFSYVRALIEADRRAMPSLKAELVEALKALDRQAPHATRAAFERFLASLDRDARSFLITAPEVAELSWRPIVDRPLNRRFFEVLEEWDTRMEGPHADPESRHELEALGKQIVELAKQRYFTFDEDEKRHTAEVLLPRIADPEGAAIGVPVLVAAGLQAEIAQELGRRRSFQDPDTTAQWYLEVRTRLRPGRRTALVDAIHEERGEDGMFLVRLNAWAHAAGIELPELHAATFDPRTMFDAEASTLGSSRSEIARLMLVRQ
jgi:hypothetical protein